MNIYLMGMMGCGKSTLGRMLEKNLRVKFVDLDDVVEKNAGMTISQIFEKYGESHFRKLESEALVGIVGDVLVALGGGVPLSQTNREMLKKSGICIFIDRPMQDILADIDVSSRPLLQNGGFEKLYDSRLPIYRGCADYTVDNSCKKSALIELENIVKKLWAV